MNQRMLTRGRKAAVPSAPSVLRAVQRKAAGRAAVTMVPPAVHDVLRSPGQSLDPAARTFLEPRFGHDFSRVRVHTDTAAAESARAMDARAYTAESHVVFGAGQYAPGTSEGRRLLAHELTHVVQQTSGARDKAQFGDQTDPQERAADRAADAAVTGNGPVPTVQAGLPTPLIQRQAAGAGPDLTLRPSPFFLASVGSQTIDGFPLDEADLNDDQKTRLDLHAKVLLTLFGSDPDATVEVIGHTDATGTEKHNLALGTRRAEAARDELVAAGVPAKKLVAKSVGESELKVPTEAPEPRNRRVEVHFEPAIGLSVPRGPGIPSPTLVPPLSLPQEAQPPPPQRGPDLRLPPPKPGPEPPPQRDFFKPIPPAPKGTGPKSPLDVVFDKVVDPIVNGVTRGLSKDVRDWVRDKAHDAVKAGITKGLEASLQAAGLGSSAVDAIKNAADAAIRENGQPPDRKSDTEGSPLHQEGEPPRKQEQ